MFSTQEYVTASRTDQNGYLKLVSTIDLMQDCSQMWLKSESDLDEYFRCNHMAQLLVSRQTDIIRIPKYNEKLTTTTSVFESQGFYGYRNTIIYDEQAIPCITSWSMGAFVDMRTNKLSKVPQEILSNIVLDGKYEMKYLDRKIKVPANPFDYISFEPIEVLKNDIDMNKHMNNSQYVRIAVEYLPDEFEFRRMRIEYKTPAKRGALIYPKMLRTADDKIIILLTDNEKLTYANFEFSI